MARKKKPEPPILTDKKCARDGCETRIWRKADQEPGMENNFCPRHRLTEREVGLCLSPYRTGFTRG